MKFKVVVTDWVFENLEAEKEILSSIDAEVVAMQAKSRQELVDTARDADALLNTYFGPIDDAVFSELKKCKLIVRYGIGLDTIDIPSATRHGIMVANIPGYCVAEVSEHTLALVLALARKLFIADKTSKTGDWQLAPLKPLLRIEGQTAGIIGFGRIGRAVAKKLAAFGMNVVCHDPFVTGEAARQVGAMAVSIDDLLVRSDFVLLHCPASQDTRHIIGKDQLNKMKKTAYLINTARGALVDTAALSNALKNNEIAGAAMDDVESKPPASDVALLADCPNLILTPHSAWLSVSALHDLQRLAAEEVKRVLLGEPPVALANPEVLKATRA